MNGYKVELKFTVGVSEYASDLGDEFNWTVLERSQHHPLWVVVIGMDVVPDNWCSL